MDSQLQSTSSSSTPPPKSLNRQDVLDEDEYTAALSHIIARDFFPSLVHLDATNTYLDALRTEDPSLINASVRRLQQLATPTTQQRPAPLQTPSHTPWGGGPTDTPLRTPSGRGGADRPSKRPRYDTDLRLDDFQARYTSEDNSSFTQILEEENQRRKEKFGWAWDAQGRVEAQRGKMLEARERMLIEPAAAPGVREKLRIEAPVAAGLITEAGEGSAVAHAEEESGKEVAIIDGSTEIEVRRDEEEKVDVMAPKKDKRRAGVDGWKFKTRNALMFPPDADVAPHDLVKSSTSTTPSRGDPKVIKYTNTRLPEQEESSTGPSMSEPPSPTRSRIDAAIAGTPYRPRSPTTDTSALLPSMPSPTPDTLGPLAVKELMTWGTLNATPRILSQSNDPADMLEPPSTPFRIADPTPREAVAQRLSNGAAKSLRERAALMGTGTPRTPGIRSAKGHGGSSMGPPTWTPRRIDAAVTLTPAAKRLLDRSTSGVASSRRADAMGKTTGWEGSSKAKERDLNKVRWTPSPALTRNRT
ncbi:hypothetical protein BD410DRAFT_218567 [Rickenella mellea]|uniref:Nuclear protein DGCR14 n=1 Tax=Rickenella mellea TaxID=50990 RepID=A0A4Y7QMB4_9AGAM|nr:hypothetical protein BD410DRAFT_218567 [Rickenella mellea]